MVYRDVEYHAPAPYRMFRIWRGALLLFVVTVAWGWSWIALLGCL